MCGIHPAGGVVQREIVEELGRALLMSSGRLTTINWHETKKNDWIQPLHILPPELTAFGIVRLAEAGRTLEGIVDRALRFVRLLKLTRIADSHVSMP